MIANAKRVQEVFLAALETPNPTELAALLDRECATDPDLRKRVEDLLRANQDPASILDEPAPNLAAQPTSEDTIGLVPAISAAISDSDPTGVDSAARRDDDPLAFLAPSSKPGHLGRLDHYEILEVIGKGGFGTVLKAFDEKLHRMVAIKVLSPELAANGPARNRFIREARTGAAVVHEHVVTIHAVDADHRPPYLVMQLVDGVTLQEKLDKVGTIGLREILRIGMQTAEGLAAAHRQGLVHRDIKPANILLENGVERVKITDFGLARAVDDASVTQSGTVAGTPMYMSPEQAEGLPIDHRSDLFSLGTVLYAMCTGHPPFRASGTHAVLKRVIDASPRPIREINNEIPEWLCDIIAKLHAKKPEDRFQTAKEVAELLGQRLADVQAGRVMKREPSHGGDRVEQHSAATRPLTLRGSPRFLRAALVLFVLLVGFVPLAAYFWIQYSAGTRGQVDYELDEPRVKIVILGGGHQSMYSGTTGMSEQRAAGVTHTLRAHDRDGKEYFKHEFTVEPRGKTLVRVPAPPATDVAILHGKDGWVQLFNGKDLTGWKHHAKWRGSWDIENNELVGRNGLTFLQSEREYADFHLVAEMKVSGGTGVYFRASSPGEYPVGWVASTPDITLHRGVPDWEKQPTLDPSAIPSNTWFKLEILAVGEQITIKANSKTVVDHRIDKSAAKKGLLMLHAHMKAEIRFRSIAIKELPPEEPGWVQLFNGKDLDGWKSNAKMPWSVENGLLVTRVAKDAPRVTAGANLYTKRQDYQNFHVRLEAKVNQAGDSGLYFRKLPGNAGHQAQIHLGKEGTGLILRDREKFLSKASVKPDTWFLMEVIAQGRQIVVKVDGKKVVDWQDPDTDPETLSGAFGLETGHPGTELYVKKIEIKELPPEEPGWVKLFNGKDVTGWKPSPPASWTVKDGILSGAAKGACRIATERTDFQDYHLRFKAKAIYGLTIVCRADDKGFHSIDYSRSNNECSFSHYGTDRKPRGEAWKAPAIAADEWFDGEMIVQGPRMTFFLNGFKVAELTGIEIRKGRIDLVVPPAEKNVVQFQKVEIKELPPEEPGWVPLFNGKDLNQWLHQLAKPGSFTIVDDTLTGNLSNSTLLSKKDNFRDFHLKMDVRSNEYTFASINVRSKATPRSGQTIDLGMHGGPGKGFAPGSIHYRLDGKPAFAVAILNLPKPGEWFTLEVIAKGKFLETRVNGNTTQQVNGIDGPEVGGIAIDLFGDNKTVQIRNVQIKELPPPEPAFQLLFTGKDGKLDAWEDRHSKNSAWKLEGQSLQAKGQRSTLATRRNDYADFHLRMELMSDSTTNATLNLRTDGVNEFPTKNVKGIEISLKNEAGKGFLGQLHYLGTHWQDAKPNLIPPNQWFTMDVIAQGKRIIVKVNDQVAVDHIDDKWTTKAGVIAIHQMDKCGLLKIRSIQIKELPPALAASPFVIPAKDAKTKREFATVKEAIAAAGSDDRIEVHGFANDPADAKVVQLRGELVEMIRKERGKREAILAARMLTQLASPADAIDRAKITPQQFASIGFKEADKAPKEVVAVIDVVQPKNEFPWTIPAVAFSPDGRWLARTHFREVTIWDVEKGVTRHKLTGHREAVTGVAFSPDGKTLASSSLDGTVQLWNPETGGQGASFAVKDSYLWCCAFSPDGKQLAAGSGSRDNTNRRPANVYVWEIDHRQLRYELKECKEFAISSIAYTPSGMLAACDQTKEIIVWAQNSVVTKMFPVNRPADVNIGSAQRSVVISPDGKFLASATALRAFKVWNLSSGQEDRTLTETATELSILGLAYSLDGGTLAAVGVDGVSIWDPLGGVKKSRLPLHSAAAVAFAPDGRHVAVARASGTVVVLRLQEK